jgi:NhaP-type Na+/H+ or K+/H+ antiporter
LASLAGAGMASASAEVGDPTDWLTFGAMQVVLGPLAGALVGYVGAKAVAFCYRKGWMAMSAEGIVALALAFTSFGFAELVHGNGFIAAFVAGLVFGNTLKQKCEFLYEFTETEGTILVLATFMAFGGAMIPEAWGAVTVAHLGFALVALTLVRILPVFLSLLGTGLRPATWGFLGWFGPRGLASVLFVLLVLERVEVPNEAGIFAAVVVTVALSIVLHGVTAVPAARRYAEMAREMGPCEENMPVSEEPFTGAMRGPGR